MRYNYFRLIFLIVLLVITTGVGAQNLELLRSKPSPNESNVSQDAPISLVFDDPLDVATVTIAGMGKTYFLETNSLSSVL